MSDNQFDFGPAAKQIESLKGAANGLASLDSNGLVPSSQLPGATQSGAGLMSAADKTKLDGIATGATANVVSDSLSDTSTTNALSAAKGKALNDSVTTLNTQMANKIGYVDVDISGTSLSLTEGSYNYAEINIGNLFPSGSTFISAAQYGASWNTDVMVFVSGNTLKIISNARTTIGSNRKVRVIYYIN